MYFFDPIDASGIIFLWFRGVVLLPADVRGDLAVLDLG